MPRQTYGELQADPTTDAPPPPMRRIHPSKTRARQERWIRERIGVLVTGVVEGGGADGRAERAASDSSLGSAPKAIIGTASSHVLPANTRARSVGGTMARTAESAEVVEAGNDGINGCALASTAIESVCRSDLNASGVGKAVGPNRARNMACWCADVQNARPMCTELADNGIGSAVMSTFTVPSQPMAARLAAGG